MGEVVTDPVLLVGGGPVSLTSAILLARLGVPSLLVERRGDVTMATDNGRRTQRTERGRCR
jgi:3-(3-hydroxy-phenyl)propionate hydroxylase